MYTWVGKGIVPLKKKGENLNPAKRIKTGLKRALSSVTRKNGKLMYIPLFSLPLGAEFFFTTEEYTPETQKYHRPPPPMIINGQLEDLVLYVPAGRHKLQIWPSEQVEMTFDDGESQVLKPLLPRLTPTSTFTANFDDNFVTYRLQTGEITEIRVDNYCLRADDFLDEREEETTRPKPRERVSRSGREVYDRGIEQKLSQQTRQATK